MKNALTASRFSSGTPPFGKGGMGGIPQQTTLTPSLESPLAPVFQMGEQVAAASSRPASISPAPTEPTP